MEGDVMMKRKHGQMSESFITAVFLSLSGGLQDAYTYIFRGRVFANAQTGNIVLLSQSVVNRDWRLAMHYMVPLIFFSFGIIAAEGIRIKYQKAQRIHWRQLVLLIEMILLLIVGFVPQEWNLVANGMVSFACAMQVQTFRKVNGYAFASTMCIGNIRSGMESLCAYAKTKDRKVLHKTLCYLGIIVMFAVGAGFGGYLIGVMGMRTIWISCLLLLIGFLIMFMKEDVEEIAQEVEVLKEELDEKAWKSK